MLVLLENNQILTIALIIVVAILAIITAIVATRLSNLINQFAAFNANYKDTNSPVIHKGIPEEEVAAVTAAISMYYQSQKAHGAQPLFRVKSIKRSRI